MLVRLYSQPDRLHYSIGEIVQSTTLPYRLVVILDDFLEVRMERLNTKQNNVL